MKTACGPTPELLGKHDIAPPQKTRSSDVPAWCIKFRWAALLIAGKIEQADAVSCERYYKDRMQGEFGANTSSGNRVPHGDKTPGGGLCADDHRVDALARSRATETAVGLFAGMVLDVVIVHDASWASVGKMLRVSDKTAVDRAVFAIKVLTKHYADVDQRR